jgi:hypothetical protein
MTTVGYGDYFPITLFGRILNLFISLFGISITSMIVSILSVFIISIKNIYIKDFIIMNKSENRVLKVLKKLDLKNKLKK